MAEWPVPLGVRIDTYPRPALDGDKDAGTSVGSRMVDQELEKYINLRQARSVVAPCRLISEPTVLPRGYYRAVDSLEALPQPHAFLNCGATLFLVRTAQWSR